MGRGSKMTKCDCSTVFRVTNVRMVAANEILSKMLMDKELKDQFFLLSTHYVLAQPVSSKNRRNFLIPFSNAVKKSQTSLSLPLSSRDICP